MAEVQGTFQCSVCDEQANSNPTMINPRRPEYVVCEDCAKDGVVPQIEAALKHEVSYPPSFGNIKIDYKQFLHLLPDDFQSQYRKKVDEYVTPVGKRIYCKNQRSKGSETSLMEECGVFLGEKHPADFGFRKICPQCPDLWTCAHCCQPHPKDTLHQCEPTEEGTDDNDDLGALRCPNKNCRMPIELKEACNSLKCPSASCRMEFCNVCRKPAKHDSDHWKEGNPCPRFGKPGEDRAIFDPRAPQEDEAEDIGIHQAEIDAHPIPEGDFVDLEMANWRDRAWNFPLVHDEDFILDMLRMEFGEARLQDVEPFNIRLFLDEIRFAMPIIALWRGTGLHLDRHNMQILLANLTHRSDDLAELRRQVPDEFMGRFPQLLPIYERTAEKIGNIRSDLQIFMQGEQPEPLGMEFVAEHLPVVYPEHIALFRDHRVDYMNHRQVLIDRGGPRFEIEVMDIAVTVMRLIEANLEVPEAFLALEQHRWNLMVNFFDRHYELQSLIMLFEVLHAGHPDARVRFDGYERVAQAFMALFPPRVLMFYRRGWHPNGRQNGFAV